MRRACCSILLLACLSANAGTLAQCQTQDASKDRVRSCVQAERIRSANQLRKAGIIAQTAVRQQAQESGLQSRLRAYRSMQARHVRERSARCHKQASIIEQAACEADMNNAQIEQLARFTE